MLSFKKALTKITEWTDSPVMARAITLPEITIGASQSYTDREITIPSIPSGYRPVLVVCRATGSYAVYCYQCAVNPTTYVVTIQLRNTGNSSVTISPMLTVLYVKQP